VPLAPLVLALVGCSSHGSNGDASPAFAVAPACATPLVLTGDPVPITGQDGAPPPMNGGPITRGTYDLSLSNQYVDAAGNYSLRVSFTFDGANFKHTVELDGPVSGSVTRAGTYMVSGQSITFNVTCESDHAVDYPEILSAFSSDGHVLTLSGVATLGTDNVQNTYILRN
jgi:hypothetical protein